MTHDTFLAAIIWTLLAGVQLRTGIENLNPLPFLLALESGLVAYLLLARSPDTARPPRHQQLVAWTSVGLPLVIRSGSTPWYGQLTALIGLLLSLWGLWALGKSFGIAPADRGLVRSGPYRFLRHPMYAGALLNALGAVLGKLSSWNMAVLGLMLCAAVLRIRWEEQVIGGYGDYARTVRWRLFPGVW